MRKIKIFAFGISFLTIFACFGCGKRLENAQILRDDLRVGGSISFVYDKKERQVFVGGDGEILQYTSASEEKGFDGGNRVGIKVVAPNEKIDLKNSKLEMNGVSYCCGNFLETIDGQKQRFFTIYPNFDKENKVQKFSVVWDSGTEKQDYIIKVLDGTKFADKDGNIE